MTDQLELDALSERVAKVLGWSVPDAPGRAYWRSPDSVLWRLPAYASDWSLLPEMLAWLRERGMHVRIQLYVKSGCAVTASGDLVVPDLAEADTLPEAVARLVVAVAERERKEQP